MEKITDAFQKMFLAGLGAVSISTEKAKDIVEDLVKEGNISKEEGDGFIEDALRKGEALGKEVEEKSSEMVKKTLEKMNLATDDELSKIRKELEELKKKVRKLESAAKKSDK